MANHSMFEKIKADMAQLEAGLLSVTHSPVPLVNEISVHLIQAGGKRLRPALYFLSARCGDQRQDALQPLAAALELIHMATLVHDDVIDDAATRRGAPTANTKWGNQASILTGDYLFARAFALVAREADRRVMQVLTEVICNMCEGELIQNREIFNPDQTEAEYYDRIARKTADFIAASCKIGAITGGLPEEDIAALERYGHAIGMAFQITDDILDVTATDEQIGKPAGNDLRQGIVTLPVLYALENSPMRRELRELVETRDMNPVQAARALALVKAADGVSYAYRKVDEHLTRARESLPACAAGGLREAFLMVADFVAARKF